MDAGTKCKGVATNVSSILCKTFETPCLAVRHLPLLSASPLSLRPSGSLQASTCTASATCHSQPPPPLTHGLHVRSCHAGTADVQRTWLRPPAAADSARMGTVAPSRTSEHPITELKVASLRGGGGISRLRIGQYFTVGYSVAMALTIAMAPKSFLEAYEVRQKQLSTLRNATCNGTLFEA